MNRLRWRLARLRFWWECGGFIHLNRWTGDRYAPPEGQDVIEAGRRLGMRKSTVLGNWWVAYSPRNGLDADAEGAWGDWVALAGAILEHDRDERWERQGSR